MQKPGAQIINFENNRNINKSIVFVSLLIHYFAICSESTLFSLHLWHVNHLILGSTMMGSLEIELLKGYHQLCIAKSN